MKSTWFELSNNANWTWKKKKPQLLFSVFLHNQHQSSLFQSVVFFTFTFPFFVAYAVPFFSPLLFFSTLSLLSLRLLHLLTKSTLFYVILRITAVKKWSEVVSDGATAFYSMPSAVVRVDFEDLPSRDRLPCCRQDSPPASELSPRLSVTIPLSRTYSQDFRATITWFLSQLEVQRDGFPLVIKQMNLFFSH